VVEGQTLKPGAVIAVDGTTVSLAPDATIAVINEITKTLAQVTKPAALTFGGHVYAAQTGSTYVIDGKTLTPGGLMTLAGGTTISLASSGSYVVINGVTSSIPGTAGATQTSVLTVRGRTYTASSGSYVIDGQTLTSGGLITLSDGTTLSLGASELVINGQTSTFPTAQAVSSGVITIGGQTFTSLTGNTAHRVTLSMDRLFSLLALRSQLPCQEQPTSSPLVSEPRPSKFKCWVLEEG